MAQTQSPSAASGHKILDAPKPFQPFHNNESTLTKGLGFTSVEDMKQWLQSDYFKFHYDILHAEHLQPERERRLANNEQMLRGPDLKAIQQRVMDGEAFGIAKYSTLGMPDKSGWDAEDHLAYFLYKTVEHNTLQREGIFFTDPKPLPEKQFTIWQALLYMKMKFSKSKVDRAARARTKRGAKDTTSNLIGNFCASVIAGQDTPSRDPAVHSAESRKSDRGPPNRTSAETNVEESPLTNTTFLRQRQSPDLFATPEPVHQTTLSTKEEHETLTFFHQNSLSTNEVKNEVSPEYPNKRPRISEEEEDKENIITSIETDDQLENIKSESPPPAREGSEKTLPLLSGSSLRSIRAAHRGQRGEQQGSGRASTCNREPSSSDSIKSSESTSNLAAKLSIPSRSSTGEAAETTMTVDEALALSPHSERMNLAERYWQYVAIRMLVNPNEEYFEQGFKACMTSNEELSAESVAWRRQQETNILNGMVNAGAVSDQDVAEFRDIEEKLRHLETEYTDSAAAKRTLGMSNGSLRVPGMPRNVQLHSWQITGLDAILKIQLRLRGALLADVMGIGKTPVMVAHILFVSLVLLLVISDLETPNLVAKHGSGRSFQTSSGILTAFKNINRRRQEKELGVDVRPAFPYLVLVPPNLIRSTIRKIRRFSKNTVIYEYHGDDRRRTTAGAKMVDGTLHKEHPLLSGKEHNDNVIIVSSHPTWAARHGPSKLTAWRCDVRSMDHAQAKRLEKEPDFECPYLLNGRINIVWVDEAHEIKRPDSHQSLAVQWLEANFVGLATATPGLNRIGDTKGYQLFCQPREKPTTEQLREWGVDPEHPLEFNPYEGNGKDPSTILRLSADWSEPLIYKNENQVLAGFYLSKMNELFVVRRTYATVIDGKSIGSAIPSMVRRYIDTEFSPDNQKLYDKFAKFPLKRLMTVLPNGNIAWNQKHFRHLVLDSTWLYFEYIRDDVYADSLERWKKSDNLLFEWLRMIHEKNPCLFDLPDKDDHLSQIRVVTESSPKIRAMLAIIAEVIVKHERKAAVWELLPAEQLLVWDILTKLHLDPVLYSSDLTQTQRDDMIDAFTSNQRGARVLITSYSMSSYGLDLQDLCADTISLDIPMSRAIRSQAEHRFRRFGQTRTVISWNIAIRRTINDRQMTNKLSKAIPHLASELNSNIFDIQTPGDDNERTFSIGQWVVWDRKLMRPDDSRIVMGSGDEPPKILEPREVIQQILYEEEGTSFTVDI